MAAMLAVGCSTTSNSRVSTNAALFTQGSGSPNSASGVLAIMQAVQSPVRTSNPGPPPPASVSAGSPLVSFQNTASLFREQVQLLEMAPSTYGAASVRRAVATLADAVESVPFPEAVDVVGAAQTMREEFPDDVGGSQAHTTTAPEQMRRALQTAAGAMILLSHGPYARASYFTEGADQFEKAADAVNPGKSLPAQQGTVLAALRSAADALYDYDWPAAATLQTAAGSPGQAAANAPSTPATGTPGAAEAQAVQPHRDAFDQALWVYSASVDRFVSRPADQPTESLVQAFGALADAIAAIPAGSDVATYQTASVGAASVRALARDFRRAAPQSIEQSIIARRLFETAGGVLFAATEMAGPSPAVSAGIRALRREGQTIADKPLDAQPRQVADSLEAAERALRVIAMMSPP
jgi:hypothetical protein